MLWFFKNADIGFFIWDQSCNVPHRKYTVILIVITTSNTSLYVSL